MYAMTDIRSLQNKTLLTLCLVGGMESRREEVKEVNFSLMLLVGRKKKRGWKNINIFYHYVPHENCLKVRIKLEFHMFVLRAHQSLLHQPTSLQIEFGRSRGDWPPPSLQLFPPTKQGGLVNSFTLPSSTFPLFLQSAQTKIVSASEHS
jgi:hypothetical protein